MEVNELSLDIIEFCSIECQLQGSGERSVSWMCQAWQYAMWLMGNINPSTIQILGGLVEPVKNHGGFRKCGVRVGSDIKPDWMLVPSLIADLCERRWLIPPHEFFRQYEEVHPFVDGNGRTGAILFNWLSDTMDKPTWPPNFWNDPRRREGYGA